MLLQAINFAVELGVLPLGTFADGRKQAVWHVYSVAAMPSGRSHLWLVARATTSRAVLCAVTDKYSQVAWAVKLTLHKRTGLWAMLLRAGWQPAKQQHHGGHRYHQLLYR